jgi:hypothetical protein
MTPDYTGQKLGQSYNADCVEALAAMPDDSVDFFRI